jgi:hypothetical protein
MKRHQLKRLQFTAMTAACMLVLAWLIKAESSPLYNYFLYNTVIPNLFGYTFLPSFIVGSTVSGNIHQPNELISWIAFAIQWSLIGYIAALIIFRKNKTYNKSLDE